MADYSQYQGPNPDWEAFTQTAVVPPVGLNAGESPENYRLARNSLRASASKIELESEGLAEKVSWDDTEIPTRDNSTISARIYRPRDDIADSTPLPVYLFFHGGGYLFGGIDTEDATCSRLIASASSPLIVVHASYRHTPHFKYPTPQNDAWDAFLWLTRNICSLGGDSNRVVVGGISSGGGLAASVVLRAQEAKLPVDQGLRIIGQLLMIPWLIPTKTYPFHLLKSPDISSYVQNIHAPNLPRKQLEMFVDLLDAPDSCFADRLLCPPLAPSEKLKGLPKTAVVVAGMDPLRDEALLYVDKLTDNGVPTRVYIFPGLPHGFRRFQDLQASRRWDEVAVESLRWLLSNRHTSGTIVELPPKETKENQA